MSAKFAIMFAGYVLVIIASAVLEFGYEVSMFLPRL